MLFIPIAYQLGSGKRIQQETTYLDERDRNDYFRPSQYLFKKYCEDVVTRYNLADVVQKSEVKSISYSTSPTTSWPGVFTLDTSTGIRRARIVVFAVGGALNPVLPPDCPFCGLEKTGSVTHAFMRNPSSKTKSNLLPAHVLRKIASRKSTNIVVVGGGLTSAQITDTAIMAGVTKVWHLMRGPMKVKHFDVDLPWVGKYKNYHLSTFWSTDRDEERFEMLRDARGGGSITPEYKRILLSHTSGGKASLHEYTHITNAAWDEGTETWEIETQPEVEGGLPRIDHVIYATGLAVDFKRIPALQQILLERDIRTVGGMPCLTDDLMWSGSVPFFVTGRLAALSLGPSAGNLEGARQGAERVAWKVGELLRRFKGTGDGEEEEMEKANRHASQGGGGGDEVDSRRLGLGMENQFAVLGLSDEEED